MRVSQRDMMRRFYREQRGNPDQTIRAFADAERHGDVRRASNYYNIDVLTYARILFADGLRRGWLKR
jgi:hypothetical protein